MIFRFRPLPGFTAFALLLLAALVALGFWQLQRLQWKESLIAQMGRNMHAQPIPLAQALVLQAADAQYRHVELNGTLLNEKEVYVFTTDTRGDAVYHVLTPVVLGSGRMMIVDRGFVPPRFRDPATRRGGELGGAQHIEGFLRTPDRPGLFTPAPDLARKIWYARDLRGIAAFEHIALASPMIVEADATPNPGGWPKGGQTVVNLPNNHLQYAITWFLLASALAFIYFAYHVAHGRLAFGSPESGHS